MSLSKVEIKNFQSHKHSVLNLSQGVNVIVGTSDSGKSAIIRALRWVFYNLPLGDSFRSNWGGDTSISLTFEDGKIVTRYRSEKANSYIIGENRLDAIRTGVPELVRNYLQIEEVNFQQQLDPPFLLSSSSGEVSSYLNKIVKLDKIDSSLSFITSEIYNVRKEIEYKEQELERIVKKLDDYKGLDQVEQELEVLEEMERTKIVKTRNIQSIQNTLQTISKIQKEMEGLQIILKYEAEVNKLLSLVDEEEEKKLRVQKLDRLITQLQRIEEEQKRVNCIIRVEKEVNELTERVQKLSSLQSKIKAMENKVNQLVQLEGNLKRLEESVSKMETEFWRSFPEICPLCGSIIRK